MNEREIETFEVMWGGIALCICFERNWLGSERPVTAHLEIRSVAPEGAPLPITETGYQSHFVGPAWVDDAGGPVAYVLGWLDTESRSPKWKAADNARRQLSLF